MIRVPTPLIPAVKELSRLHRQGHTAVLLQSLQELIAAIDSNIDSSQTVQQLAARLDKLEERFFGDSTKETLTEQKLEALTLRLAQLETVLAQVQLYSNKTTSKRQGIPYGQFSTEVQLQSLAEENLAKRLGVEVTTLERNRRNYSQGEFETWCRNRDPRRLGWCFNESDGVYHPKK